MSTKKQSLAQQGYTVVLEWCGHPEQRHVARHRGAWIGQDQTKSGATMLCLAHADEQPARPTLTIRPSEFGVSMYAKGKLVASADCDKIEGLIAYGENDLKSSVRVIPRDLRNK